MIHPEIPPNQQLVNDHRWPVVGEKLPRCDHDPWTITIAGEVESERVVPLSELTSMPLVRRQIDVHCVTRWSKLKMSFTGIPLLDLIHHCDSKPVWNASARFVSFVARSDRSHSTSLPLQQVIALDPLIAVQAEGKPMATEHGGPVRMVVPGKYFYKSVKWIERIEFLEDDRLGYWEADAGYHNNADPWREERYIAATIGKQEAARLIEQRDFSGRELMSLQAGGRDLQQLNARGAMLRNADFRNANLRGANFAHANLSNAHLHSADLRRADFRGADLEGADFSGADLRAADLRNASLFGCSFGVIDAKGAVTDVAVMDAMTKIGRDAVDALTSEQRALVENQRPELV